MKSTRTYAILDVSPSAHKEIAEALRAAGYDHAIHEDDEHGVIVDMHGIAIAEKKDGR